MRTRKTLMAACLCASTWLAGAQAATLQYGAAGIGRHPANLGPVGEGRRVWLKLNCYSCHGSNGGGGMGPNIQHAGKGDVIAAMLHGDALEGGMRSFAKYATKTDAGNVTAYLATIGTKNEPTWVDWWNSNP